MSEVSLSTCKTALGFLGVLVWLPMWLQVTRRHFSGYYDNALLSAVIWTVVSAIGAVLLVAVVRSSIRLALEMRDEYDSCVCECPHDADDSRVSKDSEFEEDPESPGVLMYPAIPSLV